MENKSYNELFSALAKAQDQMDTAGLTSSNPFFKTKYADLAEIVKASRPALTKNGLSVSQPILPDAEGKMYLHTILGHSSGQSIESRMPITPAKADIQALGGYISYLRRYCYAALVGVIVCDETDDDGESHAAPIRQTYQHSQVAQERPIERITPEQYEQLEDELKDNLALAEEIMQKLKISSLREIPKATFVSVLKRIRDIKAASPK